MRARRYAAAAPSPRDAFLVGASGGAAAIVAVLLTLAMQVAIVLGAAVLTAIMMMARAGRVLNPALLIVAWLYLLGPIGSLLSQAGIGLSTFALLLMAPSPFVLAALVMRPQSLARLLLLAPLLLLLLLAGLSLGWSADPPYGVEKLTLWTLTGLLPAPTPALATSVYGSAQGDSRNNYLIGGPNAANLDYRFRASTTAAANSIRVQQRGDGGASTYSGGTGGTIQVSIQTDNGGVPSGTILSSLTFAPGNPSGNWEDWNLLTFPVPATLTAGQLYHIVFDNVGAAPNANWISLNALMYWGGPFVPRQPTFSEDYALIDQRSDMYGGAWHYMPSDTPIMDLAYANGVHDGMNYIGSMGPNYGSISGSANLVREHFTVSGGGRTVTSASVKVKRISGTSPLTISLEKGDGTLIEAVDIPSSAIALGNLPTSDTAAALGGNTWAIAPFLSSHVLANGATYNLVLSAPADTQYIAVPVQDGTTKGMLSRSFTDGDGQKTTDGGATWAYLYPYLDNGRQDLQFYLK